MKILFKLLLFLLLASSLVHAAGNEPLHPLPDSSTGSFRTQSRDFWQNEQPAILGRYFPNGWVKSGGTHATAVSCTSTAFATEAFTNAAPGTLQSDHVQAKSDGTGGAVPINYAAQGIPACVAGTTTVHVAACSVSANSVATNFTRAPGSNYFTNYVDAAPDTPAGCAALMDVTITNGAIVAVHDANSGPFKRRSSPLPALNTLLGVIMVGGRTTEGGQATGGDGTFDNPWTGWDTGIAWAPRTTYQFISGVYGYTTSPNFALPGLRLIGGGSGSTILKHTGSGRAASMDAGFTPTVGFYIYNVRMEGFTITGNASSTDGLFLQGIAHSMFRDLLIINVPQIGLHALGTVLNTYEDVRITVNEGGQTITPQQGVEVSYLGNVCCIPASTDRYKQLAVEGVSGIGIKLVGAYNETFDGGTSESNGTGLVLTAATFSNTVRGMDFETNVGQKDVIIYGSKNLLDGVWTQGKVQILGGFAYGNRLRHLTSYGGITVTSDGTGSPIWNYLDDIVLETPTNSATLPTIVLGGSVPRSNQVTGILTHVDDTGSTGVPYPDMVRSGDGNALGHPTGMRVVCQDLATLQTYYSPNGDTCP